MRDDPSGVSGGGTGGAEGPAPSGTEGTPPGQPVPNELLQSPTWSQCASCLAENAPDARFCERCGSELASADATTLVFDPRAAVGGRQSSGRSVLGGRVSEEMASVLLLLARQELTQDYEVECEIGRGGMAVVYRAVDRHLRRTVALKVLPPELALSTAVVGRFQREAQVAASLDHPNIIPIYRVGQSASLLYLAMKYVEGRPLDVIIADQGALPISVVLLVLRAGARALTYAHEHGIVHRDIKSGNILIDLTGRAIVTDFGVARAIDNASLTKTGTVIGTPYFMSPEQCAGKVAGPQSDQYSLGVVAFQMLTGVLPFQADMLAAIMHHHFFTPVPDVTKVRTDVPVELSAILGRILSKDPSRRFGMTAELRAALDAVPLAEADREQGEAILRGLARGSPMPRVETSSIPPLADTMAIVAAHDALMRSVERFRRARRQAAVLGGLILTAALVFFILKAAFGPDWRLRAMAKSGHAAIASPATGRVRIETTSGLAAISIDGQTVGQGASVDHEVVAGSKRLHITAPGYVAFDSTIVIKAGETTRVDVRLRRTKE